MLRGFSAFLAALALAACVSACAPLLPFPQSGEQPSGPAAYHNGYLGLTVTVPDGWYEEEKNSRNLTGDLRDSADWSSLDLYDYGDGGYAIQLITMQNGMDSAMDDHAELMLYADYYPNTGEDEYLGWISDYITDRTDGEYFYDLMDVSTQYLGGRKYTRFLATVSFSDGTKPYYEEYYIAPVNGTFFVAYINYWSDSRQSKSAAYGALNSAFTLGGYGGQDPIQWV